MASRLLGFARDVAIAAILGAGPAAEAFLVAFSLPNMFRRFFAEGAFNTAFVPAFAKRLEAGEDAAGFAREAASALLALVAAVTLLAMAAMPLMVLAMASGFAGDARFDMAVLFGRIVFPYILLISLAALLSGVLNATGRFAAAAAAPILLNLIFLAALALAVLAGWPAGPALAWAVPVAGLAQLALLWRAAARAGFRIVPGRPRLTARIRRLAVVAAPAALAGGVVQVNLLVGRQVASFFDGAVAWLAYADRLYQLPLGVVGIGIGVVLLPDLSRRLRAGDDTGGQGAFNRAAEIALALSLPAAVALIVIPGPIVGALFERGAFDAGDTRASALATAIYAAGLPAFVLQKVLQPVFFAREDTRRPFLYALAALAVNAAVAIGLAPVIGFAAAALGTTVAGWAMAALLWRGARGMGDAARPDARLLRRLPRMVLASLLMGAGLLAGAAVLSPWLAAGGARAAAAVAVLVAGGGAAYVAAAHLTGALRLGELRAAIARRGAA